jgi:hypothetical protein
MYYYTALSVTVPVAKIFPGYNDYWRQCIMLLLQSGILKDVLRANDTRSAHYHFKTVISKQRTW